jgi:hypothetical protein
MTVEQLKRLFDEASIGVHSSPPTIPAELRPTNRDDLNAFILLDKLVPAKATTWMSSSRLVYSDIISCAEHDQIWLYPSLEELAPVITEEQVLALAEFGIFVDPSTESLSMFR